MQHPFVDRYRDTHNSSPRSMVEEDVMNPPTSGTPFTGVNYVHIKIIFINISLFRLVR